MLSDTPRMRQFSIIKLALGDESCSETYQNTVTGTVIADLLCVSSWCLDASTHAASSGH